MFVARKMSDGAILEVIFLTFTDVPKISNQSLLYPHSVCFLSSIFFAAIYLFPSLFFLLLFPPPPFPFPSLQDPTHYYTANSDDVHDEVDGRPVVDGVGGLQQHKAHAHVIVGSHLQEPVNPVKDVLSTRTKFGSDRGLHGGLRCDAQRDGEEGEVVASM